MPNGEGWWWDRYFTGEDGPLDEPFDFGGDDWINSAVSKKYIREEVKTGDLVICYQSDKREILGLTQMDSDGEQDEESGEYNRFFLRPAQEAFPLARSLRIAELRRTSCDPVCFRLSQPGTVFPVKTEEFDGILNAIVMFYPATKEKLRRWLRYVNYSYKV
jgi:hypothetical protein